MSKALGLYNFEGFCALCNKSFPGRSEVECEQTLLTHKCFTDPDNKHANYEKTMHRLKHLIGEAIIGFLLRSNHARYRIFKLPGRRKNIKIEKFKPSKLLIYCEDCGKTFGAWSHRECKEKFDQHKCI